MPLGISIRTARDASNPHPRSIILILSPSKDEEKQATFP
jgi:hypothetical protein